MSSWLSCPASSPHHELSWLHLHQKVDFQHLLQENYQLIHSALQGRQATSVRPDPQSSSAALAHLTKTAAALAAGDDMVSSDARRAG